MSDVWSPGEAGFEHQGAELGGLDYEGDVPLYGAFNPVAPIAAGIALLGEAPAIGLLGGGVYWLLAVIPAILGAFLDIGTELMAISGSLPPELTDLLGSLGTSLINLFFAPLQWMVWGGTTYAAAWYVKTGEVQIARIFSGAVFWRVLVFGVALAALQIAVTGVLAGPLVGVVYVVATKASVELGIGVGLLGLLAFLAVLAYVGLALWAGWFLAVLDGAGPGEALIDSWHITDIRAKGMLLVTLGLAGLLNFVAGCMCFVPGLFVQAVYLPGMAACWLRYSRGRAASEWGFFQRHQLPFIGE